MKNIPRNRRTTKHQLSKARDAQAFDADLSVRGWSIESAAAEIAFLAREFADNRRALYRLAIERRDQR